MPKCGGTSIAEALYATVPIGAGLTVLDAVSTRRAAAIHAFAKDDPTLCHEDFPHGALVFDLREKMLLQAMAADQALIHGHVLWSERAAEHFAGRYRFVTILRGPEARMLSNYHMAVRAGLLADDLDAYLDTPVAESHARVFLRYLSGRNVVPDQELDASIALAIRRLDGFAVVGFLDDLAGFRDRYRAVFGVGLRIRAYNRAATPPPDPTPQQMARVTAMCEPDRIIYDAARARGRG
jgi:hypothetical protein